MWRRPCLAAFAASIATAQPLYANDASIAFEAGAPRAIEETEVRMVSEHLIFRHRPAGAEALDQAGCSERSGYFDGATCVLGERWEADLTYVFKNTGDARTLQIGLPFRLPPEDSEHSGPPAGQPVGELRTWIDDQEAAVTVVGDVVEGDGWMAERTYLVEVPFDAGQTRVLRHRFEAWAGGNSSGGTSFSYLLETGRGWAGPIGDVRIEFDLGVYVPCLAVSLPYERIDNTVVIQLRDWEPDRNLELLWLRATSALASLDLYDDTPGAASAVCSNVSASDAHQLRRTIERMYGAPDEPGDEVLLGQPPQVCLWNDTFAGVQHADPASDVSVWLRDSVAAMQMPERPDWVAQLAPRARECLDSLPTQDE